MGDGVSQCTSVLSLKPLEESAKSACYVRRNGCLRARFTVSVAPVFCSEVLYLVRGNGERKIGRDLKRKKNGCKRRSVCVCVRACARARACVSETTDRIFLINIFTADRW